MISVKKNLANNLVIALNLAESIERMKRYQKQFERIHKKYNRDFPEVQAEREKNGSFLPRFSKKFSPTAGLLGVALVKKKIKMDQIQANLVFEQHRLENLWNKAIEAGLPQFVKDMEQKLFDELRLLCYDEDDLFILTFKRVPEGSICPKGYEVFFPSLGICLKVQKLKIPKNEKSTTWKNKITRNILRIDYEVSHPIFKKKCPFCKGRFYTLNNIVIYCCPDCKDNANDLRRKKGRRRRIQGEAVNICPECGDKYPGKAKTCNKSRCKKRDYRKRKKLQLH